MYLGDHGAYLAAFIISILLIEISKINHIVSPFYVANLLWYPAFENFFSIIRKIIQKKSPMSPDNHHLHQLLFSYFNKNRNFNKVFVNSLTACVINSFNFIIILLLIYVSLYGITASGSQRWINLYFLNLQPSELMKIAIIICFAKYYHRMQINDVNSFKNLIIPIIVLVIPVVLVLSQPDLGTAILIALSGLIVIWLSGVNIKYFTYSTLVLIISMPFVISFLKPYQKLRILTFFDPDRDPLGAGYQIIQSKIAVGSGGLSGKGFLKGTQNYLEFLPEKHTDFIFTLFSEEFGFLGSLLILLIYSFYSL